MPKEFVPMAGDVLGSGAWLFFGCGHDLPLINAFDCASETAHI